MNIAFPFIDIREFTKLAERNLPYDLGFLLNNYFCAIKDCINHEGGCIGKFIGDVIMALFGLNGDPQKAGDDSARAMCGILQKLNITS
jgi:adenylate cyclase